MFGDTIQCKTTGIEIVTNFGFLQFVGENKHGYYKVFIINIIKTL